MLAFIFGGSASGKSEYAENLAVALANGTAPLCYVATMEVLDPESRQRIARHKALRADKHFETFEQPRHLHALSLPKGATVLVECLSTLTANEWFHPEGTKEKTASVILKGIDALCRQANHVVLVSSDVFRDGGTYDSFTQDYLQKLGILHQSLGSRADLVVEVVSSIPIIHKDMRRENL